MISVVTSPQIANYSKKVLWWTDYWSEYGHYKYIDVKADLPSGVTLLESNPTFTASDTHYNVGVNVGMSGKDFAFGISGGVSFVSKAINITNKSNTHTRKIDMRNELNSSIWRWDWERYKYGHQQNRQLFAFSVLHSGAEYNQRIEITTAYGTVDSYPNYWMNVNSGTYVHIYSLLTYSR